MKKLNNWLKELTLTQQLMSLILVFVAIFASFLFIYLNGNINSFVRNQMFMMLQRTQVSIVYNYRRNPENDILSFANDANIAHAIYHDGRIRYSSAFDIKDEAFLLIMKSNAATQLEKTKDYVYKNDSESETLYSITNVDDDTKLISIVVSSYQNEFKKTLINSVINITVLVVSILFFLLMIWVIYLIRSLNQIRGYINKLRNNEEVVINVDRKDEIGELGTALVAMSNELKKQEQIKEELVQNISHDLKTPIATIKSYGESIKDGIYPYETLEKSVDVIIEHASRLEKKVQSLLLLNRVGYLVTSIDTKETDLYDVIEKTLLSLKVIRPELKIISEIEHAMFYGNEEPWRVVVENIMDNALRYAKSTIVIKLTTNELSIENDGSQLTNEIIEKMFKPFEKGTDGQFGLGLSIVHRIVTAYDCEVYAYNSYDGVVFKINKKNPVKQEQKKKEEKKNKESKKKKTEEK